MAGRVPAFLLKFPAFTVSQTVVERSRENPSIYNVFVDITSFPQPFMFFCSLCKKIIGPKTLRRSLPKSSRR
jgi:hypothetical protein